MLNSNTSLHLAVQNGNIDIVKMLLEAGHSPNEVNADGLSPLGLAVQMGHTDIVTLLAERTEKNDHPIIAPASTTPVDTSHNVGNAVNLLRKEKSMKRQYFADSETGRIYGNAPPIPSTEPESPPIKITWGNFLRMNIFTGKIMSDDQLKEQEIIEQQKWESRGWAKGLRINNFFFIF